MIKLKTVVAFAATTAALSVLVPEPPLELPTLAARSVPVSGPEPVLPPFVLPLVSIHPKGFDWSTSTGFVVDRARGYIIASAHVGVGPKFQVLLPGGVWLPATRIRSNAAADLALLALPDGMGELLPEPPQLRHTKLTSIEFVAALGWRLARYGGHQDFSFRATGRMLGVIRTDATLCTVSLDNCLDVGNALMRYAQRGYIPDEERSLLYSRYILMLDVDEDDHSIQFGLSGGPVVDSSGRVAGVVAFSNGFALLAIPVDEVQKLIR